MKVILRNASVLALLLAGIQLIQAQVPEGINYQAVARDNGGQVLENQSLTVRLTIKENGPAGSNAYQETHTITTNDFGLFSLIIGQGNPTTGSFGNINWGSTSHFLKVEVDDGSGYVSLGTSQFVSVPYALYAKEAGNGGGTSYNAGTGIDISGNTITNTGDTDATDDLTNTSNAGGDVSGNFSNLTVVGLQGNPVSSAAPLQDQVLKWNGSQWAPANDLGGGAGDDWGNQTVQSDATLEGNGTSSNLLKIGRQGASNGEILKWDGTSWLPSTDENTTYSAGNGIALNGTTFSNTGDTDASDDITNSTSAGGDLNGTYPNPTVQGIHGRSVSGTAPANGEILKWNGSSWEPAQDGGSSWSVNGNYTYTFDTVGIGTSTPDVDFQVLVNTVMFGSTGNGSDLLFWGGDNAAFRAGRFYGTSTELDSMGLLSFATGGSTLAKGDYSTATGRSNRATGDNSFASGNLNSVSGDQAAVFGYRSHVSGSNSMSIGSHDTISGSSSFSTGSYSKVMGSNSVAMGYNAVADHLSAFAIGNGVTATNQGAVALGQYDSAQGQGSVAMGNRSVSKGAYSIAGGDNAITWGSRSIAFGPYAEAFDYGSIALGNDAKARGFGSAALGYKAETYQQDAVAIGYNSEATSRNSVAIGNHTNAYGEYSIAMGNNLRAQSAYSIVLGRYNKYEAYFDSSNWSEADYIFSIGNGTSNSNRSNAFTIMKSGNVGIGIDHSAYPLRVSGIAKADTFDFGSAEFITDGGAYMTEIYGGLRPTDDGLRDLGTSSNRWDDIYATNGTIQTSDKRDKENIRAVGYGMDAIMQLKPVAFNWKQESDSDKKKLGFLAQDLLQVLPEVVKTEDVIKKEDGTTEVVKLDRYGVYYSDIIPVLVKGIQEQQLEIENLKQENKELKKVKAKCEELERRIEKLELR